MNHSVPIARNPFPKEGVQVVIVVLQTRLIGLSMLQPQQISLRHLERKHSTRMKIWPLHRKSVRISKLQISQGNLNTNSLGSLNWNLIKILLNLKNLGCQILRTWQHFSNRRIRNVHFISIDILQSKRTSCLWITITSLTQIFWNMSAKTWLTRIKNK